MEITPKAVDQNVDIDVVESSKCCIEIEHLGCQLTHRTYLGNCQGYFFCSFSCTHGNCPKPIFTLGKSVTHKKLPVSPW